MPVKISNLNLIKLLKGFFIFLMVGGIFMAIYFPNYTKLKQLKETNRKLLNEKNKLEEEIKELEEKIAKGRQEPFFWEKFVREELGVAKKDEIVVDILE